MTDFEKRFIAARKSIISKDFSGLNPMQLEAAMATEGPLLILAGAGSGKTTVLINRIACILKYGRGGDSSEVPYWMTEDDLAFLEDYNENGGQSPADGERARELCSLDPAKPWQVIAITFTNKAADELVKRLEAMLGPEANDIWASTFHSACVKILRRYADRLGHFSKDFTIYDTSDSMSLIKRILKDLEKDEKKFAPRAILSSISAAKDAMLSPEQYKKEAGGDIWRKTVSEVYAEYRKRMLQADAMDFDDLILYAVKLLEDCEEVREFYQRRFRYVLVDEYQDTNMLQYRFAKLLAGGRRNICVVGDDDQSIYKFRGATIENILGFEEEYRDSRVIRLEQNYRSTANILNAANEVIKKNERRKGKRLWTQKDGGEVITLYTAQNENDEAAYIASRMLAGYSVSKSWRGFAVLYRMNAMSNRLEYAMKRNAIPYRIYGGMRFYDRAEIKDMLAYLCVVSNQNDELRLRRIINNPPRGIGEATIDKAAAIAASEGISLYSVLKDCLNYTELRSSVNKLKVFTDIIEDVKSKKSEPLDELYDYLLTRSGYITMLESKDLQENITRAENVKELKTNIVSFLKERNGVGTLEDFLDEMALYSDMDAMGKDSDCVALMTMHSAKGLEFPTVFIAGAEEGIFPGLKAIGEPDEIEEERRLCYVAITRAKNKLYITNARQRMLFGRTQNNQVSRFIADIPEKYIEKLPKHEGRNIEYNFGDEAETDFHQKTRSYHNNRSYDKSNSQPWISSKDSKQPPKQAPSALPRVNSSGGGEDTQNKAETYKIGDTVKHKAFGRGCVLSTSRIGPDTVVEIAFESTGTKKLMLSFAGKYLSKD
jgi:DNA helicase-2/ATP-dependent DNA helicase PcrA